jgi:hypothetical protein
MPASARQFQNVPVWYPRTVKISPSRGQHNIPVCRAFLQALWRTRTADPLLTMEVRERHARTRAITRDTAFPANRTEIRHNHASRDVARVVSDVSVLCPHAVDDSDNIGPWTFTAPEIEPRRTPSARRSRLSAGSTGRAHCCEVESVGERRKHGAADARADELAGLRRPVRGHWHLDSG